MIKTNDFPNINNRVKKLCAITNNYKFDDLAKAIFCINICVNNRAVLESGLALNAALFEYVERDNKSIRSYEEFCDFFTEIEVILQATYMDDYVVEDFGDAKLVVDGKTYDIIIGTGYNQVFACVHFLQVLAKMLGKESELFDNTEEFITDCRNNGRHVTRLTKAILVESFKNIKDNKNKLQDIKKDYKLNLEFTEDGKIVYNKEHVNEILNLLLEHYVTSALTDKRMLAKAIEKYE